MLHKHAVRLVYEKRIGSLIEARVERRASLSFIVDMRRATDTYHRSIFIERGVAV
jgi:hypothetical protein